MKARKMGSKLMAAMMALVMVLGLSVTAFAASTTIDETKTGSLTLYKYDYSAADASASVTQKDGTGEADAEVTAMYGDYAIAGVTFTILKVAGIEVYTEGTTAEVVYSLETDLATKIGLDTADAVEISSTSYWTSTQISTALETKLTSDAKNNVTTTIDALESYITEDGNGALSETTTADGKASWSDLAVGLYLVVETSVPDQVYSTTDPFFVSIPMTASSGSEWNYDVVAYPKNQTDYPDITKKVRESSETTDTYTDTVSTSIGDSLDYRIVSKLPAITSTATYLTQYTFVDTLSAGQKFNNDVTVSFYKELDDRTAASLATADVTLTAATKTDGSDGDYLVTYTTDNDKNTVITISLTETGLAKVNAGAAASTSTNGEYSFIVISYTATLNEDAVLGDDGNENGVELTYGRTSSTYTETLKDKTEVYTFGLDVTKAFSGGTVDDASGVEFTLTRDGKYIVAEADVANSTGAYTVSALADSTTDSNNTVFSPDATGKLYIAGLEAGTYTLTEIKTVSGYNLLKNSIEIVITSREETITASTVDYTDTTTGNTVTNDLDINEQENVATSAKVNGVDATMSKDGTTSTNAAVVIEITNTKGFSLPMTGGEGVWILTILGVLIIGLGAYSLVLRRFKRA